MDTTTSTDLSRLSRLTNERWGFRTNCFVCEPTNDDGLRLEFHHDTDRDVVVSSFQLGSSFSGAPNYVHGGLTLAVLDEIQSWATIAIAGKFAVTASTSVDFTKPVRLDRTYTAEAEVRSVTDEAIETVGRILDHRGVSCVEGRSRFHVFGDALAVDAIGQELTEDERNLLR